MVVTPERPRGTEPSDAQSRSVLALGDGEADEKYHLF